MKNKFSDIQFASSLNNEQYTPRYGVEIILPYIRHWKTIINDRSPIVWCPFDKIDSEFVKVFKENGFDVINSHIDEGGNFFTYEPEKWDLLISNPPYQGKRLFIERALSFGKPFALLLPIGILGDAVCNATFKNDLQLLIPYQRMEFITKDLEAKRNRVSFKACYFGYKIFEKDIIMLEKEDMKKI